MGIYWTTFTSKAVRHQAFGYVKTIIAEYNIFMAIEHGSPLPSSKKEEESLTPTGKTFWIRACKELFVHFVYRWVTDYKFKVKLYFFLCIQSINVSKAYLITFGPAHEIITCENLL